jgi:hypothetical protein
MLDKIIEIIMTILPFLGNSRKKRQMMAQEVKEFNLTGGLYISIFADIKMITRPVETTPTVAHFQIIFRKIPIYP